MPPSGHPQPPFEKWEDVTFSTTPSYLIEGLYDQGTLVVTYGESGSGKTNVTLSQAISIANGTLWGGRPTRQGLVVYVALEGGRGLRKRICAYKKKYGLGSIPLALVTSPLDLLQTKDVDALISLIEDAEIEFQIPCVMVVIDTLSRAMPGGDENSAPDMTAVIRACDVIKLQTGATVHLVHHSGKKQASGARGHSSLRGAVDTEIEVSKGLIAVTKQRDIEETLEFWFDYHTVEIGQEPSGKPITSIVTLVHPPGQTFRMAAQTTSTLKAREERILITLRDLVFARAGVTPNNPAQYDVAEVTPVIAGIGIDSGDLRTKLGVARTPAARKAFDRSIDVLKSDGYIDVTGSSGKANVLRLKQ